MTTPGSQTQKHISQSRRDSSQHLPASRPNHESTHPFALTYTMETNPRGIPKAPFVENVAEYIPKDEPIEATLRKFQEAVAKYKFMEINMLQRRKALEEKIPEIEKTLAMVEFLASRRENGDTEPLETQFELNETLWAMAKINPPETVNLWLGANVMLEYTIEDAKALLSSKLSAAQTNLKHTTEDLEFLRDQITTMEVNTARVYNWDVKMRRSTKTSQ
ncbi:uncharacterized protein VTP21DRAFT_11428 [Calcarisporiella thermophila]|uniref:uncharacterized protein n=1 Tax=Calcarisporiella thermophila TaxID=911321 RepID=UPI0037440F24